MILGGRSHPRFRGWWCLKSNNTQERRFVREWVPLLGSNTGICNDGKSSDQDMVKLNCNTDYSTTVAVPRQITGASLTSTFQLK